VSWQATKRWRCEASPRRAESVKEEAMQPQRMKFGVFIAPFHRVGENPLLAMDRDLELIQWLDTLGYDEAWIGEHHSAGWEIISDPALVIAAAAERTKRIKLGSGVVSLPYHQPLILADRYV
jgi:limonene 1,2-monooxygenase